MTLLLIVAVNIPSKPDSRREGTVLEELDREIAFYTRVHNSETSGVCGYAVSLSEEMFKLSQNWVNNRKSWRPEKAGTVGVNTWTLPHGENRKIDTTKVDKKVAGKEGLISEARRRAVGACTSASLAGPTCRIIMKFHTGGSTTPSPVIVAAVLAGTLRGCQDAKFVPIKVKLTGCNIGEEEREKGEYQKGPVWRSIFFESLEPFSDGLWVPPMSWYKGYTSMGENGRFAHSYGDPNVGSHRKITRDDEVQCPPPFGYCGKDLAKALYAIRRDRGLPNEWLRAHYDWLPDGLLASFALPPSSNGAGPKQPDAMGAAPDEVPDI